MDFAELLHSSQRRPRRIRREDGSPRQGQPIGHRQLPLPDESFRFLRIVQMPGGGHKLRPNLMWVGQIELTD